MAKLREARAKKRGTVGDYTKHPPSRNESPEKTQ